MRAASRSSGAKVQRAIARGVSVYQGDIDQGLADYPDQAFDYVILSQTLQEVRKPLQGADGDAARRPARDRGVSEFRPLDACGWLISGPAARRGPSCFRTTGTIRRISTS